MHTSLIALPLIGMPGLWEWLIIGLVVVVFFGAAKLPKLGKGLGEGIRNFKKGIKGELEDDKAIEVADKVSEEKGESKPEA
ncbi:MAG: twin-arginine translocase TatA/TatE family subunit [Deltaproteobacteria bacterium]|nr:twin-arginine translocase TatA/TatE family subunit [Deltaproteobacteria bacterium]